MKINNKETEITWGAWLIDGDADTFLQGQTIKPRYEYNWVDGNGVEYDNSEVLRFEKLTFQFSLVFSGASMTAVNASIDTFINEVKSGAGVSMEVTEVGKTFDKVYFAGSGLAQMISEAPYSIKLPLTFIYNG